LRVGPWAAVGGFGLGKWMVFNGKMVEIEGGNRGFTWKMVEI
jgi:hypothetical protein